MSPQAETQVRAGQATLSPQAVAAAARTWSPHEAFLRTSYFGALDGVRCFSILAVIWFHGLPLKNAPRFVYRGFLGVDMFFVLSGFLIVTLLLRERDRTGSIDLKQFYVRRSLRIMPVYYLVLIGVAFLMATVKSGTSMARAFWGDLPYLLTYTANWIDIAAVNLVVVWTLATEEQFYLVWPSVERFLKPKAVSVVLAAVLVVNQLLNFGFLDPILARLHGGKVPELSILDATFTPIALGVLLAHLLHRRGSYMAFYKLIGAWWSPLCLFAALVVLCQCAPPDISGLPRLSIQLLMTLLLASLVVREDHAARPVLTFPPVARLGVVSYGMYLYHPWAMHPLREGLGGPLARNPLVFFLLSVALTATIAELSFRFFESPLLRLKRRFSR